MDFPGTKSSFVEKAPKKLSVSSNSLGVNLESGLEVGVNLSGKHAGRIVALVMVALIIGVPGYAQEKSPIDPIDLVRRAAANEIKANNSRTYFMFKDRSEEKGLSITKEVIQTPQGGLARTIAINDKPLTAEQRAKDDQKLQKFANDPEARRKRKQTYQEEDKRDSLMLTSLPDAFLYTYAGEESGPNGALVHLVFKPNPKFNPPNHETMVYLGMQGDMLIDAKAARIAKIDGTLFKDVDFGWGILGRLYKGGKFLIEQRDVGSGHWETTRESLQFSGKILMIKSLTISSTETTYDFHPVPASITTVQVLELLYKSDAVVAENGGGVKETNHK
jgi:hypothetical protein